jgi:hypothetical protein
MEAAVDVDVLMEKNRMGIEIGAILMLVKKVKREDELPFTAEGLTWPTEAMDKEGDAEEVVEVVEDAEDVVDLTEIERVLENVATLRFFTSFLFFMLGHFDQ